MTITLPSSLRSVIEALVADGGYASVGDYLSDLVRAAPLRKEHDRLEEALLEGIDSGPFLPVTEEFWEEKRRAILEKYGDGSRPA